MGCVETQRHAMEQTNRRMLSMYFASFHLSPIITGYAGLISCSQNNKEVLRLIANRKLKPSSRSPRTILCGSDKKQVGLRAVVW